jgi:hypothetical protein
VSRPAVPTTSTPARRRPIPLAGAATAALGALRSLTVWLTAGLLLRGTASAAPGVQDERSDRDRGDVPGWVMITLMTAIVVIAILGVFQEQVVEAVRSAFSSITE